jgi:hypothetical protein
MPPPNWSALQPEITEFVMVPLSNAMQPPEVAWDAVAMTPESSSWQLCEYSAPPSPLV